MIIITTISILVITGAVWFANKKLPIKVCPICAGVSGTWLWMFVIFWAGYQIDMHILFMLLGGSVVGVAYQAEKYLPEGGLLLLWKTLFIPMGFMAAYSLVLFRWLYFSLAVAALVILVAVFFVLPRKKIKTSESIKKLEKDMEKCC